MLSFSTIGSLPGFVVATAVGNAIKNRASNEEILTVLKEVPNPNQDEDDGMVAFLGNVYLRARRHISLALPLFLFHITLLSIVLLLLL